jgi:hypothetical protein
MKKEGYLRYKRSMGTKVTEFLKIMDPYNAFPSEPFGVNNK